MGFTITGFKMEEEEQKKLEDFGEAFRELVKKFEELRLNIEANKKC